MAVDDISDFGITQAARDFIKGSVTEHDRRFAPSTAQFASHAKKRDIAESTVAFVARHPEVLEGEYPPEYRAEMQKRIAKLLGTRRITAGDPEGEADAA